MTVTKVVGWGLLILLAIFVIAGTSLGWRYITASVRGIVGAEEQIESAPSRITNYEHFFDLCAAIQRKEAKIVAQQDALELAEGDKERERIRQNIAALRGARDGDIARYNADASKTYTRARFLASDLPYSLSIEAEHTACAR